MNTSNITNYKPKDFAELIVVSVKTLQRWDREGILEANRTPTDRCYYVFLTAICLNMVMGNTFMISPDISFNKE